MCTYSMVVDWHLQRPREWWTEPRVRELEIILPKVKQIDDEMGLPDCENADKETQLLKLAAELGYEIVIRKPAASSIGGAGGALGSPFSGSAFSGLTGGKING